MPARNKKGRFVKGGSSKAITRYRTRTVTKVRRVNVGGARKRGRGRRRAGGGASLNLMNLALVGAGLAYATSDAGPKALKEFTAKIPGTKTFGPAATLGLGCLAVDRFVKPNKWLKLAGVAGVLLAASQVGKQGTNFKWVGDDDIADLDIGDDDDDVADYEE